MLEDARVCHQLAGRVRIRVERQRGNASYFAAVCRQLAAIPEVDAVSASAMTGSILLFHRGEFAALAQRARDAAALCIREAPPTSLRGDVGQRLGRLSEDLSRVSGGSLGLVDALFLALVGFAVHEAVKGHVAAPAMTLAWYALNSLAMPEALPRDGRFTAASGGS